ncbi:MAG: hypothetical protein JSS12_06525 [Verrucomicrobia bacterium]|nr:hypothetical protein [Verrucomicrobiota bacterium]
MSVITGSTGLEGVFSRMALQQPTERKPSTPAPSNGQALTVHVMTAAEEQELSNMGCIWRTKIFEVENSRHKTSLNLKTLLLFSTPYISILKI